MSLNNVRFRQTEKQQLLFCIFRNSIACHTKLCNFRKPFLKRLRKATAVMRAQMSEISGHGVNDGVQNTETRRNVVLKA